MFHTRFPLTMSCWRRILTDAMHKPSVRSRSMLTRTSLLPLCSLLLLAAILTREASAQGLAPPLLQYAAKFACGRVPANTAAAGGDVDVVVGVYASSINI